MADVYGNRYEVIERVGDGGMATVYRGIDRVLKRDVAIKVMHPHLADRNDARARFNREAHAIARLHHGNIVDVYDFSVGSDEQAFLVTEFVHGETLSRFVEDHGPFLPQATALVGHALAGALAHAHAFGIVHRDIKPDNLMISRTGELKLMDFGIATALDLEHMTTTGAIVGSPAHMAPEQIEGGMLDQRCDVFALGTVLYYLVTRKLPFSAPNPHALFRLILEARFDPPSRHNPAVDKQFEAIISRCLARHPADRYPNMLALQEALAAYLKHFRMSDVLGLLARFLKAPEVFQFDLRPSIVQMLTTEGDRHAELGQLALAIDAFNRALAVDPEAEQPKVALNLLSSRSKRRRQYRQMLRAGAVTVLAVGVAWLTVQLLTAPERVVSPTTLPSPRAQASRAVALQKATLRSGSPSVTPAALPASPTVATVPAAPAAEGLTNGAESAPAVSPDTPVRREPRRPSERQVVRPDSGQVGGDGKAPTTTIPVQLGCVPASGILTFQGEVAPGIRRVQLEPGAYVFECRFSELVCPGCKPVVRHFQVPTTAPKDKLIIKGHFADADRTGP